MVRAFFQSSVSDLRARGLRAVVWSPITDQASGRSEVRRWSGPQTSFSIATHGKFPNTEGAAFCVFVFARLMGARAVTPRRLWAVALWHSPWGEPVSGPGRYESADAFSVFSVLSHICHLSQLPLQQATPSLLARIHTVCVTPL